MGGRLSLPSRTTEVDESGRVHAEMIDELSVLTACAARVKPLSPNSRTQPSGTGVLCAVTEREVKQLWRLFKEIDRDQNGKVSPEEMMTIPQLEFNPLGKRVVTRAMTKRNSDNLSFKVPPHPRVRA